MRPVRAALAGGRWHFQHGPIDLVLAAEGGDGGAIEAAWTRFATVLEELVAELPALRRAVAADADADADVRGPVARRMADACRPHGARFITPMAAVAGAVADEIVAAMDASAPERAYVNNGGDIALRLAPGASYRVGLVADPGRHGHSSGLDGRFEIDAALPVRGVATSGWRGRSWSLGIADSVTVLARDAAAADAAATMIANEVDVPHPAIRRRRACDVDDNTDLGERLVTVEVGELPVRAVEAALERGAARAADLRACGLIWGAVLVLRSAHRVVGGELVAGLVSRV
jgi:ApbE superfamily uncharacterized protein (UPF0280 family)